MCLGLLLSQPQTYKRIILKFVKVDTSCTSVEQSLFKQIVTRDRICPNSLFLCRSYCVCAPQGFVTKHLLDLHHDELKNFAVNNLLQLVIEVVYQDLHNLLVTYWEPCIKRRDCHYITSPIGYWGKGSIVTACCDNSGFMGVVTLKSLGVVFAVFVFPICKQITVSIYFPLHLV